MDLESNEDMTAKLVFTNQVSIQLMAMLRRTIEINTGQELQDIRHLEILLGSHVGLETERFERIRSEVRELQSKYFEAG